MDIKIKQLAAYIYFQPVIDIVYPWMNIATDGDCGWCETVWHVIVIRRNGLTVTFVTFAFFCVWYVLFCNMRMTAAIIPLANFLQ